MSAAGQESGSASGTKSGNDVTLIIDMAAKIIPRTALKETFSEKLSLNSRIDYVIENQLVRNFMVRLSTRSLKFAKVDKRHCPTTDDNDDQIKMMMATKSI